MTMIPEITEMLASAGLAIPEGMIRDWRRQTKGLPRTPEAKERVALALSKRKFKGKEKKEAEKVLRHCLKK